MASLDEIVLQGFGVTKQFGVGAKRFTAVDNLEFELKTGQRWGIVGESGSGKSTLSRMLVGLETASSGDLLCNGVPISRYLSIPSSRLDFRRHVQFVAQDTTSSFDPRLTLRQSLRIPVRRLTGVSRQAADRVIDETLHMLQLDPALASRRPASVSGGQRQRFALARALSLKPRMLVCDEVVSALDVSVQGAVLNILKGYADQNGAGIVFVSHGLPAVAFLSDDLLVMRSGRVVESRPSRDLVRTPQHEYSASLVSAYGHDAPNM